MEDMRKEKQTVSPVFQLKSLNPAILLLIGSLMTDCSLKSTNNGC